MTLTLAPLHLQSKHARALNGKPAQLKGLFAPQGRWVGMPLADPSAGVQEALDQLDQARSFFLDPRAVVTAARVDRAANTVRNSAFAPPRAFGLGSLIQTGRRI